MEKIQISDAEKFRMWKAEKEAEFYNGTFMGMPCHRLNNNVIAEFVAIDKALDNEVLITIKERADVDDAAMYGKYAYSVSRRKRDLVSMGGYSWANNNDNSEWIWVLNSTLIYNDLDTIYRDIARYYIEEGN